MGCLRYPLKFMIIFIGDGDGETPIPISILCKFTGDFGCVGGRILQGVEGLAVSSLNLPSPPTTWKSSGSLSHPEKRLTCLFVVVVETECRQTDIAQSNQVALAILGCINDALCNYFVNDRRLFGVKLPASIIKCLAYNLGDAVVKNDPGLSDKRQNGSPVSFPGSFNEASANTKTVMFELKFCVKPICQGSHELKAQSSICRRIEIFREADAVVRHFHEE